MASASVVDKIVKSLSFEVVAVPQNEQDVQTTSASNMTPVNFKVRVRKKHESEMEKGVLSIPKTPGCPPERIRLISSDQTIMSFNVLMEAEFDKKGKRKPKRHFFSGCLGTQYDDDDSPYVPSSTYSAKIADSITSKSEGVLKQNFTLLKHQRDQSDAYTKHSILGKCRPGGCLDPPFGEDKYPYKPTERDVTLIEVIPKEDIKVKSPKKTSETNEVEKNDTESDRPKKEIKEKKDKSQEIPSQEMKKIDDELNLYEVNRGKDSIGTKHSDFIITYPSEESSSHNIKDKYLRTRIPSKEKQKRISSGSELFYSPAKQNRKDSNDRKLSHEPSFDSEKQKTFAGNRQKLRARKGKAEELPSETEDTATAPYNQMKPNLILEISKSKSAVVNQNEQEDGKRIENIAPSKVSHENFSNTDAEKGKTYVGKLEKMKLRKEKMDEVPLELETTATTPHYRKLNLISEQSETKSLSLDQNEDNIAYPKLSQETCPNTDAEKEKSYTGNREEMRMKKEKIKEVPLEYKSEIIARSGLSNMESDIEGLFLVKDSDKPEAKLKKLSLGSSIPASVALAEKVLKSVKKTKNKSPRQSLSEEFKDVNKDPKDSTNLSSDKKIIKPKEKTNLKSDDEMAKWTNGEMTNRKPSATPSFSPTKELNNIPHDEVKNTKMLEKPPKLSLSDAIKPPKRSLSDAIKDESKDLKALENFSNHDKLDGYEKFTAKTKKEKIKKGKLSDPLLNATKIAPFNERYNNNLEILEKTNDELKEAETPSHLMMNARPKEYENAKVKQPYDDDPKTSNRLNSEFDVSETPNYPTMDTRSKGYENAKIKQRYDDNLETLDRLNSEFDESETPNYPMIDTKSKEYEKTKVNKPYDNLNTLDILNGEFKEFEDTRSNEYENAKVYKSYDDNLKTLDKLNGELKESVKSSRPMMEPRSKGYENAKVYEPYDDNLKTLNESNAEFKGSEISIHPLMDTKSKRYENAKDYKPHDDNLKTLDTLKNEFKELDTSRYPMMDSRIQGYENAKIYKPDDENLKKIDTLKGEFEELEPNYAITGVTSKEYKNSKVYKPYDDNLNSLDKLNSEFEESHTLNHPTIDTRSKEYERAKVYKPHDGDLKTLHRLNSELEELDTPNHLTIDDRSKGYEKAKVDKPCDDNLHTLDRLNSEFEEPDTPNHPFIDTRSKGYEKAKVYKPYDDDMTTLDRLNSEFEEPDTPNHPFIDTRSKGYEKAKVYKPYDDDMTTLDRLNSEFEELDTPNRLSMDTKSKGYEKAKVYKPYDNNLNLLDRLNSEFEESDTPNHLTMDTRSKGFEKAKVDKPYDDNMNTLHRINREFEESDTSRHSMADNRFKENVKDLSEKENDGKTIPRKHFISDNLIARTRSSSEIYNKKIMQQENDSEIDDITLTHIDNKSYTSSKESDGKTTPRKHFISDDFYETMDGVKNYDNLIARTRSSSSEIYNKKIMQQENDTTYDDITLSHINKSFTPSTTENISEIIPPENLTNKYKTLQKTSPNAYDDFVYAQSPNTSYQSGPEIKKGVYLSSSQEDRLFQNKQVPSDFQFNTQTDSSSNVFNLYDESRAKSEGSNDLSSKHIERGDNWGKNDYKSSSEMEEHKALKDGLYEAPEAKDKVATPIKHLEDVGQSFENTILNKYQDKTRKLRPETYESKFSTDNSDLMQYKDDTRETYQPTEHPGVIDDQYSKQRDAIATSKTPSQHDLGDDISDVTKSSKDFRHSESSKSSIASAFKPYEQFGEYGNLTSYPDDIIETTLYKNNYKGKGDRQSTRTTPKSALRNETIGLNMGFQSYQNDKNERILETIDTSKEPIRKSNDAITFIKAQIRPQVNDIRIPIDAENEMSIQIRRCKSPLRVQISGSEVTDDARSSTALRTFDDHVRSRTMQDVLDSIYQQDLIPLQKAFKYLKQDVDVLTNQTKFRDRGIGPKRSKTIRIVKVNPKCCCWNKW